MKDEDGGYLDKHGPRASSTASRLGKLELGPEVDHDLPALQRRGWGHVAICSDISPLNDLYWFRKSTFPSPQLTRNWEHTPLV